MAGVDMEIGKRIVQYFWDPEPKNDAPEQPIWCLGQQYAPLNPDDDNGSGMMQEDRKCFKEAIPTSEEPLLN